MIWADRIAVVWALLCAVIVILNTDPSRALNVSVILTLMLWFLLRSVDFIFTGRIRRR